jgi:hypothetical protein
MTRPAAFLLAVIMGIALVECSSNYFFHHPMYETGDAAANSLAVDRAKHFAEIYGAYSRWGFHHPGPAFFYVQALGESLFFDTLKITPAPFNAQALMCLFVEVGFFVAALQVFIQWLPSRSRWWFFPLALALGILHFGNPSPADASALPAGLAFQTTWAPHAVVLIFLCLLAAGASVAAGRTEELPLLVLAGACLVHEHVAQPMFVIPCVLLAYGALIGSCARDPADAETPALSRWRRVSMRLTAPWRLHRRVHIVAGAILAIFVLPIAVDLTRGSDSNFAAILEHLRDYRGQHKPLLKSFLYFLQFGAYASYEPGRLYFDHYDPAGFWRYVRAHAPCYAGWAAAYAISSWVLIRQLRSEVKKLPTDRTNRFLAWTGAYLFLATGLTLRWGVIQDGEMYYYNAWFNFAIYYFAALIAAAAVFQWALSLLARFDLGKPGYLERGAAFLTSALCILMFAERVRLVNHAWSVHLAMHDRVARLIAGSAIPGTVAFLDFPELAWPDSVAVALQLDRAHIPFTAQDKWKTMFGTEHCPTGLGEIEHANYQKWSFTQPGDLKSAGDASQKPVEVEDGVGLTVKPPLVLDLNKGAAALIDLRPGGSPAVFDTVGWCGPEFWGEWTSGKRSTVAFRAIPVDADVELTIDSIAYLDPAHGLTAQRLRVCFNGKRVGSEVRIATVNPQPIDVTIPKAVWNDALSGGKSNAVLELDLPDAISPQLLDRSQPRDSRPFALGVQRMFLRGTGFGLTSEPEGIGAAPSTYVFDGKPVPSLHCRGIWPDGWTGKEVRVTLPLAPGSVTPFLRLQGHAPAQTGILYPYRFTARSGAATAGSEFAIQEPGPFDVVVPLGQAASTGRYVTVHLNFPQTFVPMSTVPASKDDRELALHLTNLSVTTAGEPVFASFDKGWFGRETDGHSWWHWSQQESTVELGVDRSGTMVMKADAATQAPGNELDIVLDGTPLTTVQLPSLDWFPFEVRATIPAGSHILTFRSRLPGVKPGSDPRVIAFGIRNLQFGIQ